MGSQQSNTQYSLPPPFSPPVNRPRPFDPVKSDAMEYENSSERSHRAASVISGMSAEDMEAAETLKSLQQSLAQPLSPTSVSVSADNQSDYQSPRIQQRPPTHLQTTSSYPDAEPEPLLSLITSQYPLAASVINGSLSIYKTAQQYTPGGEWTERHVGLPLARKTARISGVESGLRWALQPKKDPRQSQQPQTPDVEKGYLDGLPDGIQLQPGEILPAYSAGDRSPPYSEHQVVVARDLQPPPGWRQQLVITTSGLGIAMSEESLRSLRFCLTWLRWANSQLGGAISTLKDLLQQWESQSPEQNPGQPASQAPSEQQQAALTAKIAQLKSDVLNTLKQVMGIVSTYAAGALPNNARDLVHNHLVSLPQRFSIASTRSGQNEDENETTANANRVLVLASEGLDMMNQVSRVVNDTLVSAEDWCEKLGKRHRHPAQQQLPELVEKSEGRERSVTVGHDTDTVMEM